MGTPIIPSVDSDTKQFPGAVVAALSQTLQAFPVDAYASASDAYAALVAAGGGELVFSSGKTYINTAVNMTASVPTKVRAQGATIIPATNSFAFTLNAGRSQSAMIGLEDVVISCAGVSGANGIKIVDHSLAYLHNVTVLNPGIGILITDSTGWTEGSRLDGVYVRSASTAGVDLQTNGGTGSLGYADWGYVHVDNIPVGGVGMRLGVGAGFSNSTIARLVLHSSVNGSIGLQVAGQMGTNVVINAVIEALSTNMSGSYAIDLKGTGTLAGADFNVNIINPSSGGGWGGVNGVNNPANRRYQLRLQDGRRVAGAVNEPLEFSGQIADQFAMFSRSPDGTFRWGPGSTDTDTILTRAGVGFLSLGGALQIAGTLSPLGGLRLASSTTTTSGTISASAPLTIIDASAGPVNRSMASVSAPGFSCTVTRVDSSANTVTIGAPGGGSINGKDSVALQRGEALSLVSTSIAGVWVGSKATAA